MIAALIKGIGCASVVSRIGFWSYTASSTTRRSTFLAVIAAVRWIGETVTSAVLATIVGMDKPVPSFFYGCVAWALYINAITFLLPDDPPPSTPLEKVTSEGLSHQAILWSFVDPIIFSIKDSTTSLLVTSFSIASIAKEGFHKVGARALVQGFDFRSPKVCSYM